MIICSVISDRAKSIIAAFRTLGNRRICTVCVTEVRSNIVKAKVLVVAVVRRPLGVALVNVVTLSCRRVAFKAIGTDAGIGTLCIDTLLDRYSRVTVVKKQLALVDVGTVVERVACKAGIAFTVRLVLCRNNTVGIFDTRRAIGTRDVGYVAVANIGAQCILASLINMTVVCFEIGAFIHILTCVSHHFGTVGTYTNEAPWSVHASRRNFGFTMPGNIRICYLIFRRANII